MSDSKPKQSSLARSAGVRSRRRATGKKAANAYSSPAVTGSHQIEAEHRTPMAGLFILDDGRDPRDPLGANAREPSLSPSASYEGSRLLEALFDEFLRGRMGPPRGRRGSRSRSGSSSSSSSPLESRKRNRGGDAEEVVRWVRSVAACPWDPERVVREHARQVLTARRVLIPRVEEIDILKALPELLELPSIKRRITSLLWKERHKKQTMLLPTRRSERISKKMTLMTALLLTERKHIGQGDQFQTAVPEWTGPPSEKELSDYKADIKTTRFLGTEVWPAPANVTDIEGMTVKRRPDLCRCPSPGSMACVRHHVSKARNRLRSELGSAFLSWGFDSMGEDASKIFTSNEQMKFHALEQLNPFWEPKTFWGVVSKHFCPKNRKDLLNYYFNVYLLRRVGNQIRSETADIDSDEDVEVVEEEEDEEHRNEEEKRKPSDAANHGLSRRSQKGKKNP